MRETNFINQNKKKWREFEQILDGQYQDPEKMNDLFIQITDDLSYSRTFYPNRSVRVYLNGLAQRIFFSIYKSRRSRGHRLISFWTDELPQLCYEARRDFSLSFFIFALACGIGVLSSVMDPDFAVIILGEDYVDMTLANIESGDPMAVYKQRGEFGMSLGITANNVFVAFLTFVMGVFFTIGTMAMLLSNGIMLGTFQYFFIEKGLFWDSFLTIWIHGTLEISAIIIAGAAGLTMGRGLVFPGTYTRIQSFQRSARRGIKIMIGIVPIIVLAAFFEGYLTRHTDTPNLVRGLFILACLLFVLAYFVWYPLYKSRKGFDQPLRDTHIPPDNEQRIGFFQVKTSGEMFSETFVFFKKYAGRLALSALAAAALYCCMVFLLSGQALDDLFYYPEGSLGSLSVLDRFFINEGGVLFPVANTLSFTLLMFFTYRLLRIESGGADRKGVGRILIDFSLLLPPVIAMQLAILTNAWFTVFLIAFGFPFFLTWAYATFIEGINPFAGLLRGFGLAWQYYGKALGLFLILLLTGALFFSISDTFVFMFYFKLIGWVVHFDQPVMEQIGAVALTAGSIFVLYLILIMIFAGMALLYYSLVEIREAPGLKERIRHIGKARMIRGMERE